MANAQNEPDRSNSGTFVRLWLRLDSVFDIIFSPANENAFKHLAINQIIAGFTIHLLSVWGAAGDGIRYPDPTGVRLPLAHQRDLGGLRRGRRVENGI
jgi:hypothetical protein